MDFVKSRKVYPIISTHNSTHSQNTSKGWDANNPNLRSRSGHLVGVHSLRRTKHIAVIGPTSYSLHDATLGHSHFSWSTPMSLRLNQNFANYCLYQYVLRWKIQGLTLFRTSLKRTMFSSFAFICIVAKCIMACQVSTPARCQERTFRPHAFVDHLRSENLRCAKGVKCR